MTNILFIGSFLSKVKGTKSIAESLAEKLAVEGIKIKLVSIFKNKFLRILHIFISILFYKEKKIHIDIFSGPAFKIAEVASTLAFIRNKKILLTLHGGKLVEFDELHNERIKKVFNRASLIQTPSLFLQSHFRKKGFEVNYLPNSISLNNFPFKRISVKPYSLLWVRAFTSIYNPKLAIEILHELKNTYPHCTLTMVGPDKGLLDETINLAKTLGVTDSLTITGPIANEELFTYYQSHQVYLNTTSYESFGVAVIEAAACGIPIVSSNVGELPFIWEDEHNILLVDNLSAKDFCRSIIQLFDNSKMSEKLSINGRLNSEKFSWENIKRVWIKILT